MAPDSPGESDGPPDWKPRSVHVYDAMDATHPGGMQANRAFPAPQQDHLDPFVLFERFHIAPDQGFGTHPHRGFEIVSYMLDGGMRHEDSMGHEHVAREGDAMHIRTGSGMQHSELPADNEACSGIQLWVNLPREQKELDPFYADASADVLPHEQVGGASVTTVLGEGSSLDLVTDVTYLDVKLDGESDWTWNVPDAWTGYCYVVSGNGALSSQVDNGSLSSNVDAGNRSDHALDAGSVAVAEGGGDFDVSTTDGIRFVAVSGEPHDEPIRQRGPFVT